MVVSAVLPAGIVPSNATAINNDNANPPAPSCVIEGQEVRCETSAPIGPSHLFQVNFSVAVGAAPGTYTTEASVSGGGGAEVKQAPPAAVRSTPLEFGFLPGFAAPATGEGGEAVRLSGSHPVQQTVAFAFPTEDPAS